MSPVRSNLRSVVAEFGCECFSVHDEFVLCKVCSIKLKIEERRDLQRPCATRNHTKRLKLYAMGSTSGTDTPDETQFFTICVR